VVGSSGGDDAFLYSQGKFFELGTKGGILGNSNALDINDAGQIVGTYLGDELHPIGYLYSSGTITRIGPLPGDDTSTPFAINRYGQVVGVSGKSPAGYENNGNHAFLYSGGTLTYLGSLGDKTYSAASAINDSGMVVGASTTKDGALLAFLYSGGVMKSLGSLGGLAGSGSSALGINNSNQIVGWTTFRTSPFIAFLYANGKMQSLGSLSGASGTSVAYAINDLGEVVGSTTPLRHNSIYPDAFIYTPQTGMQDLNKVYASILVRGTGSHQGFVSLTAASKINNQGQIIGYGEYYDGTTYPEGPNAGFLLDTRRNLLTVRH
jgi:probable HAF family extracellular repeat protein